MRTLYKSILDSDEKVTKDIHASAEEYQFANDKDYQHKEIMKVLLKHFNLISHDYLAKNAFEVDVKNKAEFNKQIKAFTKELSKHSCFINIEFKKWDSNNTSVYFEEKSQSKYSYPGIIFNFMYENEYRVSGFNIHDKMYQGTNWEEILKELKK